MPATRWPNLFVVGALKAGTTSLWRYLDEHPDIFMSPRKELFFFAHRPWHRSRVEDERTYLRMFAQGQDRKFAGESSPTYLHPEHVPGAIGDVSPDARILISLREPVDWTRSVYLHQAHRRGVERRSLGEAIREELRNGTVYPDRYPYLRPVTPAVARYLDTFGEHVHVLFFEDLVTDPRRTVRRIFEFLDLDPAPADWFDAKPHNRLAQPRNKAAELLIGSRAHWIARRIVPRPLRDPIFRAMMPPISKPELEPDVVDLMRKAYEQDVADLRTLLERRLPAAWERRFPSGAPSAAETLQG